MKIIVVNKNKDILSKLESSYVLEGVYNAETLTEMVKGFAYEKIIIDITSIENYFNIENLKELVSLNPHEVILFLDDKTASSKGFLSDIVNLGFYNFTRNLEGIKHLILSPNTFENVKSLAVEKENKDNDGVVTMSPIFESTQKESEDLNNQILNPQVFDASFAEEKLNAFVEPEIDINNNVGKEVEPTIIEVESEANITEPIMEPIINVEEPKPIMEETFEGTTEEKNIEMEGPILEEPTLTGSTNNNDMFFDNEVASPNELYTDETNSENMETTDEIDENFEEETLYEESDVSERKIIGVKNLTKHAGATSLVYMMHKELKKEYDVIALEVDELEFAVFKDKTLMSVTKNDLTKYIQKYSAVDIILVDLNNYVDESFCDEVLYLVEPSNKMLKNLMLKDKEIFKKLKGKKIILNKSLLVKNDVREFEYEAKTKVFYNLPPLDDRANTNKEIVGLLNKMLIKI